MSKMLDSVVLLPELWHQIAYLLQPSELICLMRVSRTLNTIVEEHLYQKITWSWNHSTPATSTPIHQLLLNMLHRPELALHVHEVSLKEIGYGPNPRLLNVKTLSYEDCNLARDLVQEVGLPKIETWIKRLCDFEAETIIALIVLQLRNVQKLTIDMFHRGDDSVSCAEVNFSPLGDVLRSAFTSGPTTRATKFERLTKICWPSECFDTLPELTRRGEVFDVIPVLRAPQLKVASLKLSQPESLLETSSVNSWLPIRLQSTNTLTRLSLRYTTIMESFLVKLLSCMDKLETFRLELFRGIETQVFNGSSVLEALKPCRTVLRHLIIEWHVYDGFTEVETWSCTPLGSLTDFCALQYIEATMSALVDNVLRLEVVLPRSLKILKIRQGPTNFDELWEEELGPKLEAFFSVYRLYTPYLNRVMVGLWEPSVERDQMHEDLRFKYQQDHGLDVSFFSL